MNVKMYGAIVCLAVSTLAACIPPMAVVQDASLLDSGESDATLYASSAIQEQTDVGLRVGLGVSERADLRMGGGMSLLHSDSGTSVGGWWFEAGPKFSLIDDHIALYAPGGLGSNTDTLFMAVAPTLIGSADPTPWLTLSLFLKGMLVSTLRQDTSFGLDGLWSTGINATLKVNDNFAIVPELSIVQLDLVTGSLGIRIGF